MRNDAQRISEEIRKQRELDEERIETSKQILKNLEKQKKIEKELLDLVNEHQNYWKKELKKANENDIGRYNDLKDRLQMEEEIRNKILDHINHIDKEIKAHKERIS